MVRLINRVLDRYGVDATVAGVQTRIIFHFSGSKSWDSMDPIITPVGQLPGGQYLYMAPAELEIDQGDEVVVAEKSYIVRRCEIYQSNEGPLYRWGLCVQKGEDVKWGL